MTYPQVIRIEDVDFDYALNSVEGTVICRQANGVLTWRRISVPANPHWTHGDAVSALTQISAAT